MKKQYLFNLLSNSFPIALISVFLLSILLPGIATAQSDTLKNSFVFGVKVRAGGRYDNVRMCVGSPAGVKGGPAADVSFFMEFGMAGNKALQVDIPLFRPILFAASFDMLQFEPSVILRYRRLMAGNTDFIAGPSLGVSLHYGPDYKSESSGENRTESFFAMGPIIGGYFGFEFKRQDKALNIELGVSPYVTPLFSINDPLNHSGVVIGGTLDLSFRF